MCIRCTQWYTQLLFFSLYFAFCLQWIFNGISGVWVHICLDFFFCPILLLFLLLPLLRPVSMYSFPFDSFPTYFIQSASQPVYKYVHLDVLFMLLLLSLSFYVRALCIQFQSFNEKKKLYVYLFIIM